MTDLLCFGSCVLDLMRMGKSLRSAGMRRIRRSCYPTAGRRPAAPGWGRIRKTAFAQLQAHNVKIDWLRRHAGEITTHSRIQLDAQGDGALHPELAMEAHRHFTLADFPMEALPSLRALSLGSLFTLHELEVSGWN